MLRTYYCNLNVAAGRRVSTLTPPLGLEPILRAVQGIAAAAATAAAAAAAAAALPPPPAPPPLPLPGLGSGILPLAFSASASAAPSDACNKERRADDNSRRRGRVVYICSPMLWKVSIVSLGQDAVEGDWGD